MEGLVFTSVSVAGAPAVEFCIDPAAGDVIAPWLLGHGWLDEPVQRAFLRLVEPGARGAGLRSHLGTFSLPAAAPGPHGISVDGAPAHGRLPRAAARGD